MLLALVLLLPSNRLKMHSILIAFCPILLQLDSVTSLYRMEGHGKLASPPTAQQQASRWSVPFSKQAGVNAMKTYANIPYAGVDDGLRYMDVFVPEQNKTEGGILFIHGGGWSAGNKEKFHSLAAFFCSEGYTCASMSYRLSGHSTFPAQLEDAHLGMAYMKQNARPWKLDPERIVSFGSSAGGHLALLLALVPPGSPLGHSAQLATDDTLPRAVVAYCPVTDLKKEKASYAKLMGEPYTNANQRYLTASPIDLPQPTTIPMLVINGDGDTVTPLEASETYCRTVQEAGGDARLVVLKGVGHGFGYGVTTEAQQQAVYHVRQFLHDVFPV
ncbi:alpha/beta hydrolase [Paenibacillus ginsengarvi]|uniref:Alpha/beta hydrolase n=2 Tax=Paenibacillus ginsengarvi TaxID=400777 RepID=A0A3B0CR38_9BACL|nr:alpha/beta hydrolase [Paenibacillus ginsengarvi]